MSRSNLSRISNYEFEWWRLFFLVFGLMFLLFSKSARVVGAETNSVWRTDHKTALQEAEERKLPLLIHFYADWCMPCQRMERDVFSNSSVRDLLGTRFIALKVNSDHRQDLVRRYGIETLPSDIMIDPLSGRTIKQSDGFQDINTYLARATEAETMFKHAHPGELVVAKSQEQRGSTIPASVTQSDKIELGDPRPVIGLDGFSPIGLTKKRQWNRGSSKYAWDYKDVTYYLSSREELLEFRNNPEMYAPKLLGCDPVILWESDKAVAGDIRFGAFFDDELFLFKSDERRRQFKENPEKYIRLQHALKADQIDRTVIR